MFDLIPPSPPTWAAFLSVWSPIGIALVALVATFVSDWRQRRHNRLSVKPYLQVAADNESRRIENGGLGPARVGSIEAAVDGEAFDFNSFYGGKKCLLKLFPIDEGEIFKAVDDFQILPGKPLILILFSEERDGGEILSALARFELKVENWDMYDKKMKPATYPGETQRGLQEQEEQAE